MNGAWQDSLETGVAQSIMMSNSDRCLLFTNFRAVVSKGGRQGESVTAEPASPSRGLARRSPLFLENGF